MMLLTWARSAAPSTETRRASGSAVTLEPGIELSMALLIVPAQWPQVMSSTRTDRPAPVAAVETWSLECWWLLHMGLLLCKGDAGTLQVSHVGRSSAFFGGV